MLMLTLVIVPLGVQGDVGEPNQYATFLEDETCTTVNSDNTIYYVMEAYRDTSKGVDHPFILWLVQAYITPAAATGVGNPWYLRTGSSPTCIIDLYEPWHYRTTNPSDGIVKDEYKKFAPNSPIRQDPQGEVTYGISAEAGILSPGGSVSSSYSVQWTQTVYAWGESTRAMTGSLYRVDGNLYDSSRNDEAVTFSCATNVEVTARGVLYVLPVNVEAFFVRGWWDTLTFRGTTGMAVTIY